MNKYRVKKPPQITYTEVCIRCGDTRQKTWPKGLPTPRLTSYYSKPNWLKCLLGSHHWYNKKELEANDE